MAQRQTFDISFYCRKSKENKKGLAPVELSIIINGNRTYLTLQRKERPEEFKTAMASKKVNPIKSFCENQRRLIDEYVEKMANAGVELTADNLRECIKRGYVSMQYSLGEMWKDLLGNKKTELDAGYIIQETYKKYELSQEALYKANDFTDATPADSVDIQHINQLQYYLRARSLTQQTIYNYHSCNKAAFTLAFQRGKIKSTPYAGFKMDKGEHKEKIFLTEKDIEKITKANLHAERLNKVRDLLLFQCYSGLSYSDMARLKKDDFKKNKQTNQVYIEKRRKKTNEPYTSIILTEGKKILEKYDYVLPVLSNQKYNTYLKEIQDICGLDKELHTHLGRTTYVCFLYNKGTNPEVIAKLVGHSTTKTTLKYYAEMDKNTLFNQVSAAEGKRTKVAKSSNETSALDAANDAINAYFDNTIYKDNLTIPSSSTLGQYQDEIMRCLVMLKNDKKTQNDYRVAFAKCKSNASSRLSFYEKKLTECSQKGENSNVAKLTSLKKLSYRLLQSLRNLDNKLYSSIK